MARRAPPRARPAPPPREETVVVREVGARGDGVADAASGAVYIPYTLPGERVSARLVGDRGEALALLDASPERVAAPCPQFGRCGGCALQHWDAKAYAAWKRALVVDALRRAELGDVAVGPLVEVAAASRRRAVFAVKRENGAVRIGFKARAAHRIESVDGCLVLHPDIGRALPALARIASLLPAAWSSAAFSVTRCDNGLDLDIAPMTKGGEMRGEALMRLGAATADAGVVRAAVHGELLIRHAAPVVRFAGVAVTPPPGGFLQASPDGEAALASVVERAAVGARRAIDLFAGCGSFTFPLARHAAVDAFEGDAAAVAALSEAARRSTLKPATATRRDLFLRPLAPAELDRADVVVFDPPRAGAAAQAAELARSKVPVVVGVSCNPATFARDARLLVDGGYALGAVTPVDQFPFTAHVELVGVFRR